MTKEILSGYKNYLIKDKVVEDKAKERAEICSCCPFAKKGLHTVLLKDYSLKEVEGLYCEVCKCPLSAKVRSEFSECPKNKW